MRSEKQVQDFRIGCHLSSSAGYLAMAKTAVEIAIEQGESKAMEYLTNKINS